MPADQLTVNYMDLLLMNCLKVCNECRVGLVFSVRPGLCSHTWAESPMDGAPPPLSPQSG